MSRSSQKPLTDNRSTIIKGFVKPEIPTKFNNNNNQSNFKPGNRFQSINRGRR